MARWTDEEKNPFSTAVREERGDFYGGGYIEDNFNPCGPRSLRASNLYSGIFFPINLLFFPGYYLWWLNNES